MHRKTGHHLEQSARRVRPHHRTKMQLTVVLVLIAAACLCPPVNAGWFSWDTSDLINAAKSGNAEKVSQAIAATIDKDAKDDTGATALMYAAGNAHIDVVKLLLEGHGAEVNAADGQGRTALMFAAEKGHARHDYHDSAEHFSRLNALLFTGMDWIFIPAYCFAVP